MLFETQRLSSGKKSAVPCIFKKPSRGEYITYTSIKYSLRIPSTTW